MKKITALFLLVMFLSMAAFAQRTKRLGVIGSSTAAGYQATDSAHSFVHLVVKHYDSLGFAINYNNIAESGRNCYQGMPTGYTPPPGRDQPMTDRNITKILSYHPDVVIVCYPSNNYDIYSVKEVLFCLETIRKASLKAGVPCYITTTQPRTSFSAAIRDTLRRLKDSILRRFGPFAIDFWKGMDSSNNMLLHYYSYGDGVHVNNAGHALLAKRVIAANIFSLPLPVKLENFSANLVNGQAFLQWTGQGESPATSYRIERSTDGSHFQLLTEIRGSGGSIAAKYSFTDRNPAAGSDYYRLEVIDGSNTFYSTVKLLVVNPSSSITLRVFPVPAFGELTVEIQSGEKQSVQVEILSATGHLLRSIPQRLEGQKLVLSIPVNELGGGLYLIRLKTPSSGTIIKAFTKE